MADTENRMKIVGGIEYEVAGENYFEKRLSLVDIDPVKFKLLPQTF